MTFPVAHSSQIEIFAQIHSPGFEQGHIFHLRPGRSCCPGGGGTNRRMARQSWALGWGFAKPSFSLAQSSRMGISKGRISLWAASRAWRSLQAHPRGCRETAQGHQPQSSLAQGSTFPFPPVLIPNPSSWIDSLPITAISHPHTWLCSVEKKGIALIFQQFRARSPCWHREL